MTGCTPRSKHCNGGNKLTKQKWWRLLLFLFCFVFFFKLGYTRSEAQLQSAAPAGGGKLAELTPAPAGQHAPRTNAVKSTNGCSRNHGPRLRATLKCVGVPMLVTFQKDVMSSAFYTSSTSKHHCAQESAVVRPAMRPTARDWTQFTKSTKAEVVVLGVNAALEWIIKKKKINQSMSRCLKIIFNIWWCHCVCAI